MLAATSSQPLSTWTASDNLMAASQGWGIFEINAEGTTLEIQKCDESDIFATDAEADDFLKTQAAAGEPLATKALEAVRASKPV